jgi:hypothetical protein
MSPYVRAFGELVNSHPGERICVMGGGPSLAADLEKVTADVWISVNDHGAKLRKVDYVVAMDNLHTQLRVPMQKHIRPHTDAPIIGPWHWCEYQLSTWPLTPKMFNSGVIAVWVAHLMGAHPVIMAGFDCYNGHGASMSQHKNYMPFINGDVRVVSGPLTKFYPEYRQNERRKPFVPPEVFKNSPLVLDEIKVRVRKPVDVRGKQWPVGTELIVSRYEVQGQLKHKSLEEIA